MEKNNRQAQGPPSKGRPKGPGLSTLLKPYRGFITLLVLLALISNAAGILAKFGTVQAFDADGKPITP